MSDRFSRCGKQILLNGENLAQARDESAAEVIRIMLERGQIHTGAVTPEERIMVEGFFG